MVGDWRCGHARKRDATHGNRQKRRDRRIPPNFFGPIDTAFTEFWGFLRQSSPVYVRERPIFVGFCLIFWTFVRFFWPAYVRRLYFRPKIGLDLRKLPSICCRFCGPVLLQGSTYAHLFVIKDRTTLFGCISFCVNFPGLPHLPIISKEFG